MCLDTVKQTDNLPKWGVGYKIVDRNMKSPCFHLGKPWKIGETRDDTNKKRIMNRRRYISYNSGFHIYKNKKDIFNIVCTCGSCGDKVLKVRYSKLTAIGIDDNRETIIARRMTILSEVSP